MVVRGIGCTDLNCVTRGKSLAEQYVPVDCNSVGLNRTSLGSADVTIDGHVTVRAVNVARYPAP
jgi:hypothetical protein